MGRVHLCVASLGDGRGPPPPQKAYNVTTHPLNLRHNRPTCASGGQRHRRKKLHVRSPFLSLHSPPLLPLLPLLHLVLRRPQRPYCCWRPFPCGGGRICAGRGRFYLANSQFCWDSLPSGRWPSGGAGCGLAWLPAFLGTWSCALFGYPWSVAEPGFIDRGGQVIR